MSIIALLWIPCVILFCVIVVIALDYFEKK